MEGRKSFLLRINPQLWQELERWAQEEMRSVNGQIEYLLRDAVVRRQRAQRDPSTDGNPAVAGDPGAECPR